MTITLTDRVIDLVAGVLLLAGFLAIAWSMRPRMAIVFYAEPRPDHVSDDCRLRYAGGGQ